MKVETGAGCGVAGGVDEVVVVTGGGESGFTDGGASSWS